MFNPITIPFGAVMLYNVVKLKPGVTDGQKAEIIDRVTETMVALEGEALRSVTWVRINEFEQGDWGVGGHLLTAAAVHQMASGKSEAA